MYLLTSTDFVPSDVTCTLPPTPRSVGCDALLRVGQRPRHRRRDRHDRTSRACTPSCRSTRSTPRRRRRGRPPPSRRRRPAADGAGSSTAVDASGRRQHRHRHRRHRPAVGGATDRQPVDHQVGDLIASTRRPGPCRSPSPPTATTQARARRRRLRRHRTDGLPLGGGHPVRQDGATIQPRLEVTVDGTMYWTPYDVMVDVADYTIGYAEWLAIATRRRPRSAHRDARLPTPRTTPRAPPMAAQTPRPTSIRVPHGAAGRPVARAGTSRSATLHGGVGPRRAGCLTGRAAKGRRVAAPSITTCSAASRSSTAARRRCASSTPCASCATNTGVDLRTIALHTAAERAAMFVREADEAVCLDADGTAGSRFAVPRPRRPRAGAARGPRRRRLGRVGLRRRASRVRRAVRRPRHRLHRPAPGSDARRSATRSAPSCWPSGPTCRSRRGAAGRSTRSTDAAAVGERIGYPLMVKATAGGGGRGIRRVDAPDGSPRRSPAPAPRAPRRSATRRCSSSGWSPTPATSRCRSSPTTTARCGRSACATAACSGATRR